MDYVFDTLNRTEWLRKVSLFQRIFLLNKHEKVRFVFPETSSISRLYPMHIVSLACLIELMIRNGTKVWLSGKNEIGSYLFNQLKFNEYWGGKQNYVQALDESVFNLWRYIEDQKENPPERISEYLRKNFFRHKDLSAVKLSLDEAFYNISDHARANGNAFSLVKFDQEKEVLSVAICDFGRGICDSVRNAYPEIPNDKGAIMKAMERNFTTKSTKRNMGFGMDSIRGACSESDSFRIFSNNAVYHFYNGKASAYENDFHFPGTIIFYEISLSHFEDEDIIDNFDDIF